MLILPMCAGRDTGRGGGCAALARGKRSKLKRAKNKYAHQDDEDRQLALEVLAPAGVFGSTFVLLAS